MSILSPSADALLDAAQRFLNRTLDQAVANPDGRANEFAWFWGYTADACLTAFERCGDERFLDWIPYSYEKLLAFRDCELGLHDEYRGRITQSWGSGRYLPGTWMTHVTMGGRIIFPSLRFAQIILDAPQRFGRHVDTAKRYIDIGLGVAHEYDEDFVLFDNGERYYHMPIKGDVDTINHVNSLVNAFILLSQLAGDEQALNTAIQCCRVFKQTISITKSGAYTWPLRPLWTNHRNNRRAEPIWKAQISSATALYAWRAGLYFDVGDMQRFARTISEIVLSDEDGIRDRVHPRQGVLQPEKTSHLRHRLVNVVGFLPWAQIDPSIEPAIVHRMRVRDDVFRGDILRLPTSMRGYAYLLPRCASQVSTGVNRARLSA